MVNKRVQEAQDMTAKLLRFIIDKCVEDGKTKNISPYDVSLNIRDVIVKFTADNFTTTMTTTRYFNNLVNNSQMPIKTNFLGEVWLNDNKVNMFIGQTLIAYPLPPDPAKPHEELPPWIIKPPKTPETIKPKSPETPDNFPKRRKEVKKLDN